MLAKSDTIPCNLCGGDDAETLFEAGEAQISRIVKCRQCGLMYSNPRAKPADQDEIKNYDPEVTRNAAAYSPGRFQKERLQVRDYADTRAQLARLYPEGGSLVEIGCGMGFLLKALQSDGWNVTGIEPDQGFCKFIETYHGLEALPTILDDANLPSASADVVVFLHVIEHVPDPLATLHHIFQLLRPGGHLVIETPRFDSLTFRLLGRRERSLSCDGHIYFFTSSTLRQLCEKAGFQVQQHKYVGRSLTLDRLLWNLGVMSKSPAVGKAVNRLSATLKLDSVQLRLNMRDMQRITVRKPLEN